MSEVWYSITKKTLTDMANAVRGKVGETGKMTPSEMAATLEALNIELEDGYASPGSTEQTYTPSEGYYGFSSFTVSAAPGGGSGGSMFESRAVGIIPDIPKGYANSILTIDFESSAIGSLT